MSKATGSAPDAPIVRAVRIEQFQDYLVFERGLSERTLSAYGRDLTRWLAFVVEA